MEKKLVPHKHDYQDYYRSWCFCGEKIEGYDMQYKARLEAHQTVCPFTKEES